MKGSMNLNRFEYGNTRAWWVRVEREGRVSSKLFSDRKYGGKRKAFKEAQKYLHELYGVLPKNGTGRYNQPPGPGVAKINQVSYLTRTGERKYYQAWSAWIRIAPGHQAGTHVSIDKWGRVGAKKRVMAWLEVKRRIQKSNYSRLNSG